MNPLFAPDSSPVQAERAARRDPFSFGRNWSDFLRSCYSAARVEQACRSLTAFLGTDNLHGRSFLDIGCGSGLMSLVAYRLGASRIESFDIDPWSVRCCRQLREQAGDPPRWKVMHGSILDSDFIRAIEPADVVYSWGVLHHTGRMWEAIRNAASLIRPSGLFYIAIYNRVEYDTLRSWRGSHGWLRLKRLYNRSGVATRRLLEGLFAGWDLVKWLATLRNPVAEIRRYSQKRGMSWWHDIRDMLGGYPYEFASAGEVFNFCHLELGLELTRLRTVCSTGCNEFLFKRPGPARRPSRPATN